MQKEQNRKPEQQAEEYLWTVGRHSKKNESTPKRMKDADVYFHRTNQWLMSSGLKMEFGGLIIAVLDQSLARRLYYSNNMKDGTNPLYRMCGKFDEQNLPKWC